MRLDDVETDEAEVPVVRDGAEATRQATIDFGDQESVVIGLEKAAGVVQTRIPAFMRGQLNRERDFVTTHRSNAAVGHRVRFPYSHRGSACTSSRRSDPV